MDFIVELPKIRFHHDVIFVMQINYLTNVAHFIPINTIENDLTIVIKFFMEIIQLHEFLDVIIFNKDPKFISLFWITLHQTMSTKLNMSSTYHP